VASQSRNTIIGTVSGFLILVVGGLLFGIIIIRRKRNGNGKNTLVAGNCTPDLMIDKAMNTLSRAVMYLIIDPNLSANRAHIATNKLFCYHMSHSIYAYRIGI
jgi:hypothetical protein